MSLCSRVNYFNVLLHYRRCIVEFAKCERYLSNLADVNLPVKSRQPKLPKPSSYFITTPIYYVNAVPHIGHLYTSVLADTVSRWYGILGVPVSFSTGTDEHGLKIQQAAAAQGKPPQTFCDEVSQKFKDIFVTSNIKYTDFIRTTEERHRQAVCQMWDTLSRRGYIFKGSYEGWYSIPDEAFLTDDQVMEGIGKQGESIKVGLKHKFMTGTTHI